MNDNLMLFLAAIIPTIVILTFIIRHDKIEKEPPKLLIKLFIFGLLTTISAVILEMLAPYPWMYLGLPVRLDRFSYDLGLREYNLWFMIYENFIGIALIEEGGKWIVTKLVTWKNKEFNYTFDAIVYTTVTSLGFATLENILYVYENGFSTAIMRAIMSVPGHTYFGIFMGVFYGMAKEADGYGDKSRARKYLWLSIIVPTLIHGFYDFCLQTGIDVMIVIFFLFLIVIAILAIREVLKLSKTDHAIPGQTDPQMQGTAGGYIMVNGVPYALPNANQYVDPTTRQYAAPNQWQYGMPNQGQYGVPNAGQYGMPNGGQYGAPNGGQYGAPNGGQYAAPNQTQYGAAPAQQQTQYQGADPQVRYQGADPRVQYQGVNPQVQYQGAPQPTQNSANAFWATGGAAPAQPSGKLSDLKEDPHVSADHALPGYDNRDW